MQVYSMKSKYTYILHIYKCIYLKKKRFRFIFYFRNFNPSEFISIIFHMANKSCQINLHKLIVRGRDRWREKERERERLRDRVEGVKLLKIH